MIDQIIEFNIMSSLLGDGYKAGGVETIKTHPLVSKDIIVRGLELMQRPDTIDADPSKPNIGFVHVSFAVGTKEAVDAKTIELRDAGYQVTSGPRTTGDGYYESCILGPEGIQIEITI